MSSATDPRESARDAGLRYVTDARPGIRRIRSGRGFRYVGPEGSPVTREHAAWIKRLAIPPAWQDVWISTDMRGHLQATGRDARGRKQYRYHPDWRATRDEVKYDRLLDFALALPRIRRRVRRDLTLRGLPRDKVLAAAVRLLETSLLRVGNAEYARENKSFGLTTLRNRHAKVGASKVKLRFVGKSGKTTEVTLEDRRLARIIGRLQDLPGQELFQYVGDDGKSHAIGSEDVNGYLQAASGGDFTAKDFRTWAGSVQASAVLRRGEPPTGEARVRQNVVRAIKAVAEKLGNTPAVSRSAYVHPEIIDAYLEGDLQRPSRASARAAPSTELRALRAREAELVTLLRRRRRRERQAASASKRASARR